jgi:hypothetical protein
MLIVGDVRVEDLGLEVDLRGLEGVFFREHEEELEEAALDVVVSCCSINYGVRGGLTA